MCVKFAKFCVFLLCIVLNVSLETANDTSSGNCGEKATWTAYMNFASEAISKAKNSSVTCHGTAVKCGKIETLMSYLEVADEMINKAKINFPTSDYCNSYPHPILDCSELVRLGHTSSGVYTISPRIKLTEKEAFDVYCDMETDGGGWTVIQRRGNFQNPVDYFLKDWKSYKEGFGDLDKEFWLGNDNIYALTNQEIYSARFDLVDAENSKRYAHYDAFRIDDEDSKYTLHISNYSGDAGDSMEYHNNQKFSTKDQDNDTHKDNCAADKGGWWFKECYEAYLNGNESSGNAWKGFNESLARTEIKIRPKNLSC